MTARPFVFAAALGFLLSPAHGAETIKDPFKSVEHLTLKNGLQVYLAPSDEARVLSVRLEVDTGTEAETAETNGVSHLLEHVLFRDKQLQDEMSYLQLIKEAGGQANGQTMWRETSYFASIPHAKGDWLMSTLGKMILEPKISDDYVAKEKATVELERGRPGPIESFFGFDPWSLMSPKYLKKPDFWQSEFGVEFASEFSITEERLSTPKLTTAQVQAHYDAYYYPANMRLFVAGKFERAHMMAQIGKIWGTLPARTGAKLPPIPPPKPKLAPYKLFKTTNETPYVYLGTKLWDLNPTEVVVLDSYLEYLAHRMMKEVRNLKGQTYSAHGTIATFYGFGYSYIEFQTQSERYEENLQLTRDFLKNEAQNGGLPKEKVAEAIQLYLAKYGLRGRDGEDMMAFAKEMENFESQFGSFTSPVRALTAIPPETYNAILKKHFTPERAYEALYPPPLFFRLDSVVMSALVAMFMFFAMRRAMTKTFHHDKLRWVRKMAYPPLKVAEGCTLLVSAFAFIHLDFGLQYLLRVSGLMTSGVFFPNYAYGIMWIMLALVCVQGGLSLLPSKLMIMNGQLVIKSLSYYSRMIPAEDIESVETCRANPFAIRRWLRVMHRYAFYNPKFWQPGLMVNLKNGKSYFFGVRAPEKAAAELRGLLFPVPPAAHARPDEAAA